jgi:fumarate reductase subunit C
VTAQPFRRAVSKRWPLEPRYRGYLLRSVTSIAIVLWLLNVLGGVHSLGEGSAAWTGWVETQRHPFAIAMQLCALALAFHHAATWLALGPKVLPPVIARHRVRPRAVQLVGWIFVLACLAAAIRWGR